VAAGKPAKAVAAPSVVTADASAAARIDGDWNMMLSTPMGAQEMTGHFETRGESLSGHLSSPEGQMAFTGSVTGNKLQFDLKVVKPMKITLKYNLEVTGDKIAGKCKMGILGSVKVSGQRAP
jgi:carbon-monoxide dehydrogenase large subunit